MDADSSYGGSDSAQDANSTHERIPSLDNTTMDRTHNLDDSGNVHENKSMEDSNSFYHKNEITLPINCDENDFHSEKTTKLPHYLSTANLNINETLENHSNLEELNKKYNSTHNLPIESTPHRKSSSSGIDNPAYQDDEKKHPTNGHVKSTFGESKPCSNEELNCSMALGLTSPNKNDEPMTEAVNLELINLKPVSKDVVGPYENGANGINSIPTKKETDVEIGNPYDEYFVPVNEHRKYMRGEKLYVTVDKRNKKKRNRCLCWGVCLAVVLAAVIVGILAATGVIGNQEAHPIQEVTARQLGSSSDKSDTNIKAAGGLFGSPISRTTTPNSDETQPYTPGLPVTTVPNHITTETSMIQVPRTLESQMTIDNLQFTPEYAEKNSSEFKELAQILEDEIKHVLFNHDMLHYGPANIEVKVIDFMPGSVIVRYRIGWTFKDGIHNARDPIDENMLKTKMSAELSKNHGYIKKFHVPESSVVSEKVIDMCKIDNNYCEYKCSFDYDVLEFVCGCPEGKILGSDGKKCVEHEVEPESELRHVHELEVKPDYFPNAEPTPEPSAEPEAEPEPKAEPEPVPTAEPEPKAEPEPEPKAEPEPTAEPETVTISKIKEELQSTPQPDFNMEHDHANTEPESIAEPQQNTERISSIEPETKPEPTAEPETKPEPTVEPETKPEPEPEPEPDTTKYPDTKQNKNAKYVVEVEPKAEPEPTTEPISNAEPEPTPETKVEPEPTPEPKAEPEPTPEPKAEPEPSAEPDAKPEPETKPEPTPEPEPKQENTSTNEHLHQILDIEPEQPTAEPESTTELENKTEAEHNKIETEPKTVITEKESIEARTEMEAKTESKSVTTTQPSISLVESEEQNEFAHASELPTLENVTMKSDNKTTPETEISPELTVQPIIYVTTKATDTVSNETHFETDTKNVSELIIPNTDSNRSNDEKMIMNSNVERPNNVSDLLLPETLHENATQMNIEEIHNTIPVVVNKDAVNLKTENYKDTENNSTENTITVKLNDHSENIMATDITVKNSTSESVSDKNMAPVENVSENDPESTLDMSPFLPEIENDTLIHILHSDIDHYPDHVLLQNETENENSVLTEPVPGVIPLSEATTHHSVQNTVTNRVLDILTDTSSELNEIHTDSSIGVDQNDQTHTGVDDNNSNQTEPLVGQNNYTNATLEQTNQTRLTIDHFDQIDQTPIENATLVSNETTSSTLPSLTLPEIINNVHSNSFFDSLEDHTTQSTSQSKSTLVNDTAEDVSNNSNTEDLIAMETTTNRQQSTEMPDKNNDVSTKTEESTLATTIHAEVIETVTHSIIVSNETEHQYEVHETSSDILTTTEKLFLPLHVVKNKTKLEEIENESDEPLPVIPLPKTETSTSKVEKKQISEDEEFNNLEQPDDLNDHNDITVEEKSVLEKFHHDLNDVNPLEETHNKTEETPLSDTVEDKYFSKPKKNYFNIDKKDFYDKKNKFVTTKPLDDKSSTSPTKQIDGKLSVLSTKTLDALPTLTFSKCAAGQFQCVNGTSVKDGSYCIHGNDRCDSVDDCSDGSDEVGCVLKCSNNFQCTSGQCLKRHLVCDGIVNCNDGSDEINCESWSCRFDEFQCSNSKRCIPFSWKCDGRAQCPNATDEHNCHPQSCSNNEYHCTEQDTCIPASWRCDGKKDCLENEDEKLCECSVDQFKCKMGGGCIVKEQRCDGITQCPDQSDEWNCIRLERPESLSLEVDGDRNINNTYLQVRTSNDTWYPVCATHWNETYSDLVCQHLGYATATLTKYANISYGLNVDKFYALKTPQVYDNSFLNQLEMIDECSSLVTITCQEFTCGSHSSLDMIQSSRIIGGNAAAKTQWPSVGLLYDKKRNVKCTASIIAPQWVIVSYSCLLGNNNAQTNVITHKDWTLYVGATQYFADADNSTTQIQQVQLIVPHPQAKYSQFEFINDIALVKLVKPLVFDHVVSAICLPNKDIELEQICVTAGWGISKPGDSNIQLNYLPIPIIENKDCNSTKHYNGLLNGNKICAGYSSFNKSSCYNDEGAPLMCVPDNGTMWELQGILSHHDNCGRSSHPSIYTTMNKETQEWIFNNVGTRMLKQIENA